MLCWNLKKLLINDLTRDKERERKKIERKKEREKERKRERERVRKRAKEIDRDRAIGRLEEGERREGETDRHLIMYNGIIKRPTKKRERLLTSS